MDKIKLNDILQLTDLENVKIRFNLMYGGNWNPIEIFKNKNTQQLLDGHFGILKAKSLIKMDKLLLVL